MGWREYRTPLANGVRQVDLITVSGQAGVGGGLDVVPVMA
jgi:hypothetical protein